MADIIALDFGSHPYPRDVTWTSFSEHRRLISHDVIVWNVGGTHGYYRSRTRNSHRGLPQLHDAEAASFLERFKSRSRDMQAVLEKGGSVVCLLPSADEVVVVGEAERRSKIRLTAATGLTIPESNPGSGREFERCAGEPFATFVGKIAQLLAYVASWNESFGEPFLRIYGSNEVVASRIRHLNGNVLFVPYFVAPDDDTVRSSFFDAIGELCDSLANESRTAYEPPPEWAADYRFEREAQLTNDLLELERQREELSREMERLRNGINEWQAWKFLLYGHGKPLENVVANAFTVLGFKIIEQSVTNQGDIIMEADGRHVIVEVKGVISSAKLSEARELESHALQYENDHEGIDLKRVLVVNAYRATPLDKRTEPMFPHAMVTHRTTAQHTLLSTTQLLSMVIECLRDSGKAYDLRCRIIDSCGVLAGHDELAKIFVTV